MTRAERVQKAVEIKQQMKELQFYSLKNSLFLGQFGGFLTFGFPSNEMF